MPKPDYDTQNAESAKGVLVVLTVTSLLVAFPHIVNTRSGAAPFATSPWGARDSALFCLYVIAALAVGCLCGLLCGDAMDADARASFVPRGAARTERVELETRQGAAFDIVVAALERM